MARPNSQRNAPTATMQNVAEKLGLSVATVSRALRRVPGINAETRANVLQTAAELGYRLPRTYSNAATGKDRLQHIGIFIETQGGVLSHPYLTGLSAAAMTLNTSLVIHHVKPGECERVLDPAYQPRAMRSGLLSGIILIFWWPGEVVRALSQKLPMVSIMHKYPETDVDMVGIDNEGGMGTLIHDLYSKGHRRFGFLGRCSKLHWSTARFGGYVAALAAHDLDFRRDWVVDVDFETISQKDGAWDAYEAQVKRLTKEGVTAWVCSTEPAGWVLHDWLVKSGLRVPQDVSITGFHRPAHSERGTIDLTSVGASYESIGAAALKRLIFRIQNPGEACRSILFPCEFHPGSSVGPVSSDSRDLPLPKVPVHR